MRGSSVTTRQRRLREQADDDFGGRASEVGSGGACQGLEAHDGSQDGDSGSQDDDKLCGQHDFRIPSIRTTGAGPAHRRDNALGVSPAGR